MSRALVSCVVSVGIVLSTVAVSEAVEVKPVIVDIREPTRYDFTVTNPNDFRVRVRCPYTTRKHFVGIARRLIVHALESVVYVASDADAGRVETVSCRIVAPVD